MSKGKVLTCCVRRGDDFWPVSEFRCEAGEAEGRALELLDRFDCVQVRDEGTPSGLYRFNAENRKLREEQ